jgi:hypothetical protein
MKIQSIKVIFEQDSDSCDPNDTGQTIEIQSEDAGSGKYLVISTNRWAIDNDQELIECLTKARGVLKMLEGEPKQDDPKTDIEDLKPGDAIECVQDEKSLLFTKKARYRIDNVLPNGRVVVKYYKDNPISFSREVFDEIFTKLDFKPKDLKVIEGERLVCIASIYSFLKGYKYQIKQLSFNTNQQTAWIINDEGKEISMPIEKLNLYFENEQPISSLNHEESKAYMEHLMHKPDSANQKDIEIDKLQELRNT